MRIAPAALPAALGIAFAATPAAAAPASIAGSWKTDDGRSVIHFANCGDAVCGRIERFLVPEPPGGARDGENPDKAKRDRKLLGLRIFWNLRPDGDRFEGKGYNPEDGRYFNAKVWREGSRLKIRGCVTLFCRTVLWSRV